MNKNRCVSCCFILAGLVGCGPQNLDVTYMPPVPYAQETKLGDQQRAVVTKAFVDGEGVVTAEIKNSIGLKEPQQFRVCGYVKTYSGRGGDSGWRPYIGELAPDNSQFIVWQVGNLKEEQDLVRRKCLKNTVVGQPVLGFD